MANEVKVKPGTSTSWKNSGGDAVLTLTSLASAAGRIGAQHDFGATFGRKARWRLKTKFAVAPTEGQLIEVYLATSNNTLRDGVVGSADAALSAAAQRFQCQFLGTVYCRNTTNSQEASGVFEMVSRYVSPVIYNAAGQAFSGTASDHEFVIEQYVDEVQ